MSVERGSSHFLDHILSTTVIFVLFLLFLREAYLHLPRIYYKKFFIWLSIILCYPFLFSLLMRLKGDVLVSVYIVSAFGYQVIFFLGIFKFWFIVIRTRHEKRMALLVTAQNVDHWWMMSPLSGVVAPSSASPHPADLSMENGDPELQLVTIRGRNQGRNGHMLGHGLWRDIRANKLKSQSDPPPVYEDLFPPRYEDIFIVRVPASHSNSNSITNSNANFNFNPNSKV